MKILLKILDAIEAATGIAAIPFDVTDINSTRIVYNFYQTNPFVFRLELHTIGTTYAEALVTSEKALAAIQDLGDYNILPCSVDLNGGGLLKDYNTKTYHVIQYYDVKGKNI